MSEVYVVLGMHKSGTSLVSEMLHKSGIAMIEAADVRSYDQGNHFERTSTSLINKKLLRCEGLSSARTRRPLDHKNVSKEVLADARNVIDAIDNKHWGFKDPRTCLTYEFWKEILPRHRVICIFRSDRETHSHYTRKHRFTLRHGVEALLAWQVYNTAIVGYLEQLGDNAILISYEELMQKEAELKRLENFLGRPIPDLRINLLRRSHLQPSFSRAYAIAKYIFRVDTQLLYNKLSLLHNKQIN